MKIDLTGRTYVIMGVANKRSIAWGIAESLSKAGARLVFTYQGERLEKNVRELSSTLENENSIILPCDVTNDEEIDKTFKEIEKEAGKIHGIAHCIAFANRDEIAGEYLNTTRDGFLLAHNISAYSLAAIVKAARPLLVDGSSIITLTYLGGERVVENYNVMGVAKAALDASVKHLVNDLGKEGIRVNAISAGPIRTLAAKGIGKFNTVLKEMEGKAPLKRTVTKEEVGDTALFLMSDMSRGITGEILHVDGGYNTIGLMS